jgi:hypothetical protein
VQTLEEAKDLLLILGIDPEAVISNGELPHVIMSLGGDVNLWTPLTAVSNRISDQILKQLLQLKLMDAH